MIQLTGPVEDDYYFLSLFLGERNNERWRTINQLIGVDGNLGGAVHRLGAKFRPSTQDVVSIKTFDGITETTGIITIRDKRMCDVWCSFAYARPRAWMRNQFESRLAAAVRFFFFVKYLLCQNWFGRHLHTKQPSAAAGNIFLLLSFLLEANPVYTGDAIIMEGTFICVAVKKWNDLATGSIRWELA